MTPSTLRSSACAQTPPNWPGLVPITATGLPRSGAPRAERDTQSSAFFSWPGTEPLYSGEANSTASADSIASRSPSTASGASSSTSSSYGAMLPSPS